MGVVRRGYTFFQQALKKALKFLFWFYTSLFSVNELSWKAFHTGRLKKHTQQPCFHKATMYGVSTHMHLYTFKTPLSCGWRIGTGGIIYRLPHSQWSNKDGGVYLGHVCLQWYVYHSQKLLMVRIRLSVIKTTTISGTHSNTKFWREEK